MAATQNRDMGSGSIPKLLAQLALPAVVAQVVNLLYNIVDRIYIGHMPEVGASALTGVGLFTPILMLITAPPEPHSMANAAPAARPARPLPWAAAMTMPPKRSWATALRCC